MRERISWIDIARGVGIILVVHGHTLGSNSYRHLIYAFHMPLFFFLSGLVFNYKKYPLITTIKKSARTILVPYVIFAFLSYAFWLTQNPGSFGWRQVLDHMDGIVYGNSSTLFFNIVLWFLPVLFVTKVSFAVISRLLSRQEFIIVFLVIVAGLGFAISIAFPELRLPWGVESALTAIPFFGAGSLIRTNSYPRLARTFQKHMFGVGIVSAVLCIILASIHFRFYGHQIDIRLNHLDNYALFYAAAILGITACVVFSQMVGKSRMLEHVGKLSLLIFVLHPIVFDLTRLIAPWFFMEGIFGQSTGVIRPVLLTGIGIAVIVCVDYFYRKRPRFLRLE